MRILTFTYFIMLTISCNYEENRIKNLVDNLEDINLEVLKVDFSENSEDIIEILKKGNNKEIRNKIGQLIEEIELCKIEHYDKLGIAYLFKCKNGSRDNFIVTDEEYYLIKVINKNRADEFVNFEQFLDYRTELSKLKNDWYFVRKDIYFD